MWGVWGIGVHEVCAKCVGCMCVWEFWDARCGVEGVGCGVWGVVCWV